MLSGLWHPGTEFDYGGQEVPEDELSAILAGHGSIINAVSSADFDHQHTLEHSMGAHATRMYSSDGLYDKCDTL